VIFILYSTSAKGELPGPLYLFSSSFYYIFTAPLTEESWEVRYKQMGGDQAVQIAAGDEFYNYYLPDAETIITEEGLDLLSAEDPAMFSDDFSNPDDFYDEDDYDDFSEDDEDI